MENEREKIDVAAQMEVLNAPGQKLALHFTSQHMPVRLGDVEVGSVSISPTSPHVYVTFHSTPKEEKKQSYELVLSLLDLWQGALKVMQSKGMLPESWPGFTEEDAEVLA